MSTGRTEAGGARPGTRALLALVIGMAVLIAVGVVVVVATLVHRTFGSGTAGAARPGAAGTVSLGEPPGSRIVSVSSADGRVALLVSGGGVPDRVVLLDARDGGRVATVRLGIPAAPPLP